MSEKIIRLGLPKGSLNTPGRGDTHKLFADAGYEIRGYISKQESGRPKILNDPEIDAFLTRPQSSPVELSRGLIDIAIVGEDWIQEESVNGSELERIGDLEYGKTRLVIAVRNDDPFETLTDFFNAQKDRESPILCFTEYPNSTRKRIMEDEGYKALFGEQKPLIQVRGLTDGDNKLVQIINSDGVTEGYMQKGADIIVDNTQTGSTLIKYGLRELETIMRSSAGLYKGPSCTDWKLEKAEEIFGLLSGVIEGRKYFDVKFNVPNGKLLATKQYIIENGLCSDEPTVSQGLGLSSINILIPREKYPATVNALKTEYGAKAIVRTEVKQVVK